MLTGPVQTECSTRLVSRAELVADPPAVQLPAAFTQHARGRCRAAIVAACGCWSATALGARENAGKERMTCVVWSQQGLRPVAIEVGVPRIFSPLILSGSLGDALHNPQTLK